MPHIMIVNRLEANKERFRSEGFDQIRETGIRTNEIGLIIKTEIGLMEIGLILFQCRLRTNGNRTN